MHVGTKIFLGVYQAKPSIWPFAERLHHFHGFANRPHFLIQERPHSYRLRLNQWLGPETPVAWA